MSLLSTNRRDFLKFSFSASLVSGFLSPMALADGFSIEKSLERVPKSKHFPLGVASGDPTYNSIILWGFYTGSKELVLEIYSENKTILSEKIDIKKDGFIRLEIENLEQNKDHYYVFLEINSGKVIAKSQTGRFKTTLGLEQLSVVRLGATSCTYNAFYPSVLEHAGERDDLDAFLLLGDTSYNDGCETLEEFRKQWAKNLSKEAYIKLRSSTALIATLDDHEVTNNFDPENIDPLVYQNAKKAFFEHLPIRRLAAQPNRIWRKLSFGKTLDIFVLDCRTERKMSTRGTSQEQYISFEQMQWLKQGLLESSSVFKIILNSVPIGEIPWSDKTDRWIAYPTQRNEILSHMEKNRIENLLWVSGDFHYGSYGRISKKGLGKQLWEVLVGPGAQLPNLEALRLMVSSQFEWATIRNNYTLLEFDPFTKEVSVSYQAGSHNPHEPSSDIQEIFRTKIK